MGKVLTKLPKWFLDLSETGKNNHVKKYPNGSIAKLYCSMNKRGLVEVVEKPKKKSKKQVGKGSAYVRLKKIADEKRYIKALTVQEYPDGTKDLLVHVKQNDGSLKWEEFKRVMPIPSELKLKGLENQENLDYYPSDTGKPKILKGRMENTRTQNIHAGIPGGREGFIDPDFRTNIQRGLAYKDNILSEEARWKLSEDIKVALAKKDFHTARSHLLSLIPGFFSYKTNMDQAILDVRAFKEDFKDEATTTSLTYIWNYMDERKVA